MQHDHVPKQLNFDLLTQSQGQGDGVDSGLRAKYLLPYCCIRDSLKFDIEHDSSLKKVDF